MFDLTGSDVIDNKPDVIGEICDQRFRTFYFPALFRQMFDITGSDVIHSKPNVIVNICDQYFRIFSIYLFLLLPGSDSPPPPP